MFCSAWEEDFFFPLHWKNLEHCNLNFAKIHFGREVEEWRAGAKCDVSAAACSPCCPPRAAACSWALLASSCISLPRGLTAVLSSLLCPITSSAPSAASEDLVLGAGVSAGRPAWSRSAPSSVPSAGVTVRGWGATARASPSRLLLPAGIPSESKRKSFCGIFSALFSPAVFSLQSFLIRWTLEQLFPCYDQA